MGPSWRECFVFEGIAGLFNALAAKGRAGKRCDNVSQLLGKLDR